LSHATTREGIHLKIIGTLDEGVYVVALAKTRNGHQLGRILDTNRKVFYPENFLGSIANHTGGWEPIEHPPSVEELLRLSSMKDDSTQKEET
jgi:hypothetical protein